MAERHLRCAFPGSNVPPRPCNINLANKAGLEDDGLPLAQLGAAHEFRTFSDNGDVDRPNLFATSNCNNHGPAEVGQAI